MMLLGFGLLLEEEVCLDFFFAHYLVNDYDNVSFCNVVSFDVSCAFRGFGYDLVRNCLSQKKKTTKNAKTTPLTHYQKTEYGDGNVS